MARWFDMNTGDIGESPSRAGHLFEIEHSNGGLINLPEEFLKDSDGHVVGAVGVSGSTVENDDAVAAAAR